MHKPQVVCDNLGLDKYMIVLSKQMCFFYTFTYILSRIMLFTSRYINSLFVVESTKIKSKKN